MINFISLASGSNANCYYIGNDSHALLIDLGIGGRTIKKRLTDAGLSFDSIQMILVTHDHFDHIRHLGRFSQHFKFPVLTTAVLHNAFDNHFCTQGLMSGCRKIIEIDKPFVWRDIEITAFPLAHDATQTLGYFIRFENTCISFITDTGSLDNHALEYASRASHLVIESNYDEQSLINGHYPPELKERIANPLTGHLSNDQCAKALSQICSPSLRSVFLCHLSEHNNTPDLAYKCSRAALNQSGGINVMLTALPRTTASKLYELD